MNYKKVIVTGASGFLGSHLVKSLKNDGRYQVFALSSRPEELRTQIGEINGEFLYKDVFEGQAATMLEDAIVVNCAYPRNSTGVAVADGLRYNQRVFQAAVDNGTAAIINISSQSVYSQQRIEMATESTPVCLEGPYAVGKYTVELMLESICRGSSTFYTSLRMASLIGPGFDQRIVNRFVSKMLRHESITLVRQEKRLGFLDVEDAVSAILALLQSPPEFWKPVYAVGNGRGYTVTEIYEVVAEVLRGQVEMAEPVIEVGSEVSTTAVSFERLHADTDFRPEVSLRESVVRIFAQAMRQREAAGSIP